MSNQFHVHLMRHYRLIRWNSTPILDTKSHAPSLLITTSIIRGFSIIPGWCWFYISCLPSHNPKVNTTGGDWRHWYSPLIKGHCPFRFFWKSSAPPCNFHSHESPTTTIRIHGEYSYPLFITYQKKLACSHLSDTGALYICEDPFYLFRDFSLRQICSIMRSTCLLSSSNCFRGVYIIIEKLVHGW
jgi:hypothetical protein